MTGGRGTLARSMRWPASRSLVQVTRVRRWPRVLPGLGQESLAVPGAVVVRAPAAQVPAEAQDTELT